MQRESQQFGGSVLYSFDTREACPACGSEDNRTIYSVPFSEGAVGIFVREYYKIDPAVLAAAPFELQHCARCDLIYQHYVGDHQLLTDLYTKWCWQPTDPDVDYPAYKEHVTEYKLSPSGHELMIISSFLGLPYERIKLLDYGMGWGMFIRIADKLGVDSYGVELSQPQIEYAHRNGIKTLTDEEIGDHRFHFINTEAVFEHVTEPLKLLKRLSASLLPGGIVKISVPSGERADELVDMLKRGACKGDYRTIMPVQPLEHVNTIRRKSIQVMAELNGLKPVEASFFRYFTIVPRGGISLKRPKKALKELVRPFYTLVNKSNIYVWLQKPA